VGALSTPGTAVPARPAGHPRPPHAALQQPVPVPPSSDPPPEASYHEASSRVHGRSPVRPSPRLWPPGGAGALGLIPPELHTPPSPAAHVGVGTGNLGTCLSYVTISWSSSQRSHSPRATSCRTDLIRACPPSGAAPPCLVRPQQASNTVRFPAQDRLDNHRSIDLQQTHGWRHTEPITHCVSNQAIFVTTNGQV